LKIKKLFIYEIIAIAVLLSVATFAIVLNPLLESQKTNQAIGLFNQVAYPEQETTIQRGLDAYADFNYSSYEPAILRIDLSCQESQTNGYLTVYCNGRFVAYAYLSPESPVSIVGVSIAGVDLAKPNDYNNIQFTSESQDGFEGTFFYQIKLRGSR
jgi:hypothetical protein